MLTIVRASHAGVYRRKSDSFVGGRLARLSVSILHDGVAPNGVEAANEGETEPLRKGSRMAGLKRDGR